MLLPRLGVNQHYLLALCHTLVRYHGLGLLHPFWEQGVSALKLFLEFMNTSHPEQSLLQTSLEYLQLEVGISTPILQSDFNWWGSLATNCWLKNLWNFVSIVHIQLTSNTLETFPFQHQGDTCIMDQIRRTFFLAPTKLVAFNCCHIAHQVYFLLDFMDGWGHLLRESLCSLLASPAHSSWSWPWALVAKMDWTTWCQFLPCLAIETILGEWITPPHLQIFVPFDPTTSMAYILYPDQYWQMHRPIFFWSVRRNQTLFPLDVALEVPPNTSYAHIRHWLGDNIILAGHQ